MTQKKNKHLGTSFASFLQEENILGDATTHAVKTVLAWQVLQAMQAKGLTKTSMAAHMQTSRSQLDRLLDPQNEQILLGTMQRAAAILGKTLQITLVDAPR